MEDDDAYELVQHAYAAILWILRYIENHDLSFTPEDRIDVLQSHIKRIDAAFTQIEHPLKRPKGHFVVGIFLLILTMPHATVAVMIVHRPSPNESKHPYQLPLTKREGTTT